MTLAATATGLSRPDRAEFAGGVRGLLRLEGAAAVAGAAALYAHAGYSWRLFAVLFLVPDVGMLGYLAGPKAGAATYNALHVYVAPFLLAVLGLGLASKTAVAVAMIWAAHIGFDRALGYGLKYPTAFGDTHLGRKGR
ncbi:uncharacterized protein DUF4260 [Roseiarcus fermentans]|uniref:Uncharacterized protein DUF4260 n=1 Tax=Roseiarcus fermentans TaxID=1473586 RepID=A0A366FQD4_9HYPH|nr:DUF4260 domain-containing protein [Roseiarcus fermentans]RBP16761.1 uncharacterized protein DUF4260 [Roseiarcus fermentans]